MNYTQVTETLRQSNPTWRDYLSLTNPRVISLLLLTTLSAMYVTGESIPPLHLVLLTLIGGYLAAGGAGALNSYLDRDIDEIMNTTRNRPLPQERIEPRQALNFGLALTAISFFVLWFGVNLLAALLAMTGTFFYVVVYTYWLKRRTVQNIVIGGVAGAIAPLVGWAAATGGLSIQALLLAAIVFYWTPPHTWALAFVRKEDYARAGVPMMPVVRGSYTTRTQILFYSVMTVILTLLPAVLGYANFLYAEVALLLGGLFVYNALEFLRSPNQKAAWRVYRYSLLYLAAIFVGMMVDHLIIF